MFQSLKCWLSPGLENAIKVAISTQRKDIQCIAQRKMNRLMHNQTHFTVSKIDNQLAIFSQF